MSIHGLLSIFDELPVWEQLTSALDAHTRLAPLGLPKSGRTAVLANLVRTRQQPIVLVTGRVDAVSQWRQALETWLPNTDNLLRFIEPTPLPYDRGPWSDRAINGRMRVLTRLMAGQHPQMPALNAPPLIITSARALFQKTLPQRQFLTAVRVLRLNQIIELDKLLAQFSAIGYQPVQVVESAGQFSHRGGIFDIYPPASPYPVRIELFGDEIDTMRYFDPATQRSVAVDGSADVARVVVTPAREALPEVAQKFALTLPETLQPEENGLPSWLDDLSSLRAGQIFPTLEYYMPLLYPRSASLLDYLPQDTLLVIDDWSEMVDSVARQQQMADQIANEQASLPPDYPSPIFAWEEMQSQLEWWQPLILGDSDHEDGQLVELMDAFEPGPRYGGQMRPLMTQIRSTLNDGDRMVIVSRQATRLASLWYDEIKDQPVNSLLTGDEGKRQRPLPTLSLPELPLDGSLTFINEGLSDGFTLVRRADNEILLDLLTDAEIFGWSRPAPRRTAKPRPIAPEAYFADIQAGDYVVHIDYGVGQFDGLVVRNIGGMEREYLLIKYANSDTLYLPAHQADRLTKWIGGQDRAPSMNRLGERAWGAAKVRAQRAADELAGELLELYAQRETIAGHAFSKNNEWYAELEASFPYEETEDQLRVIADVLADMEKPTPMDRLVCGDVGYGKTEVAVRAAFKAVIDGKQVAVLVPTTILAQQHHKTFSERLATFPIEVEMLSRFRTASQQKRIVKKLASGGIDIIVGTHRLLSDDIRFKDLGLVIVDEEQRFGVAHKETFKQWRTEVDVLTMTATPIPRTLHMSLTGVRDISRINTAPAERLPVQTYVGEIDDTRLKRAIQRELDRGGQVFVVHNRVQTIDIVRKQIENLVPEAIIAVGHGQMSERKLERLMQGFEKRKIDILISTTIVESGLDFPNANTLIVDRAEMFGLAQMYQLRGRVGRGTRRAYAYFFHNRWRSLSDEAKARLEAIAENTHLGAGYDIAMRDMELRGAGDMLGASQSGQVESVGLDLYTKMIANAVKRRKEAKEQGDDFDLQKAMQLPEAPLVDLPLAAYVPTDYVPDAALRLRLYRRMAMLDTLDNIDEMAGELADRFGPIPDPIHNLLYQLRVKVLAEKAGATAVINENKQIKIRVGTQDLEDIDRFALQRYLGELVRVSRKHIWMRRELSTHEWQVELVQLLERLATYDWQSAKTKA